MKLILVTQPKFFVEEDQIITNLFEEGLDLLHLCKPDTAPMYSERLLTLVPQVYRKRIVTHDFFYLKDEFKLYGIHLNERNTVPPEDYKGHLSCTCHSLEELKEKKKNYNYVFLSPVFNSISNPRILSGYTPEMLRKAYKDDLIDKRVMAFGGVNADKIPLLKDYGFGGVVIMGDIWKYFDDSSNKDYMDLIEYFRKLRKIVD